MTPSEALSLIHQYPCDITPAIKALRDTADLDDPALGELCARLAAAMPSMQALEDLLGDHACIMANFYPAKEEATPSTDDTISTFLSTFGTPDPHETEALSRLIFNPLPDYAATLAAEERDAPLPDDSDDDSEQDRLINSFIRAGRQSAPRQAEVSSPMPADADAEMEEYDILTNQSAEPQAKSRTAESSSLTESFVRILIKNRNYAKALEIISEINLKNPKKSIYFADQIRFLKKLIINENKK